MLKVVRSLTHYPGWIVPGFLFLILLIILTACQNEPKQLVPQISVVAEGLLNPVGIVALPDGTLLIAEEGTGNDDLSAGVSLITLNGEIGRLISGLPSSRDSGDLSGAPLLALSPGNDMLYVGNFGAGHLWTLPLPQDEPLTLPSAPFTSEQLGQAMLPLNNVKLTNPFDITFNQDGLPVVTDASGNGVAVENPDGTTRFFHRFDGLVNPDNENLLIDPVPTGITRVKSEYYVTLLGGCPYPAGGGELVAIREDREQRLVADNLNMPIDVAQDTDGTIWVLEFATFTPDASCFSGMGYQQNTGVLSKLTDEGTLEPIVTELNYPGAVLPMPDGSLLVSEVFNGRILHIAFGEEGTQVSTDEQGFETVAVGEPVYREIADVDTALTAVITRNNLTPHPGADLREGDTPLAQLGQDLFFDPLLSGDKNISCATCHHPSLAMADARVLPIGTSGNELGPQRDFVTEVTLAPEANPSKLQDGIVDPETGAVTVHNPFIGQFVPRNSPTVLNAALLPVQFWDGRVESYALNQSVTTQEDAVNSFGMTDALATQALFPVTSLHEMAGATLGDLAPQEIRNALVARLADNPAYREQFTAVFGSDEITAVQVATAIAAFERRFIFTDAPWDAYVAGDASALT
ncbi:MAG: ScyD/ScyE family protein, partial [Anaerolineales bacterium]|nr:ScyD/ScyE family protein [Anaerolineales bacterium]